MCLNDNRKTSIIIIIIVNSFKEYQRKFNLKQFIQAFYFVFVEIIQFEFAIICTKIGKKIENNMQKNTERIC